MKAPDIIFVNLGIKLKNVGSEFELFGLDIAYYGVIIALAMFLAMMFAFYRAKKDGQNLEYYYDLGIIAMVFGIVGARIYYVIFDWDSFKDKPMSIFNLRTGGLAVFGGLILAVFVGFLYMKFRKMDFLQVMDTVIPAILLGQAIGRWGNFFNREAFGKYTNNLFAMQIKLDDATGVVSNSIRNNMIVQYGYTYIQVHPTFLYESAGAIFILILILAISKLSYFKGEILSLYLIFYGILRFFVEGLRTDKLYLFKTGIPVSRLVSAVLVLVGFILYIILRKKDSGNSNETEMKKSIES